MLSEELINRWKKRVIEKDPTKCWVFQGSVNDKGYPQIKIPGTRRIVSCHRLALMIRDGSWNYNSKQFACHTCDNKRCVNPSHLYWGDHNSNMRDAAERHRWAPTARNQQGINNGNAKLTEKDVKYIRFLIAEGFNNKQIARKMSMTHQSISLIRLGKSWAHLTS